MRRSHLLLSTALRAAALTLAPVAASVPALADAPPAPTALPTGMRLVAGSASAVTNGATLTVNQQSGRAAIDWKTFDIGAAASVRFHDPSSRSVTLNRVISANASQIAGRLSSNGQVVVINQSGVVFLPGSVVDAQSIVASAAGITEANMRAGVASGHFVLDQPARQGARIENHGTITVRQAGLAALVGPQVANSGVIHAPMGHVVLAGVASNVVDLYGDGLLSIDVTRQSVELAGPGGKARTALVTNTGVILAEGGSVTLTTAAVEGVIDNLVTAGGSISADSATAGGGRVVVDARGGSAIVTGALSARGGTSGGQIVATASQRVGIAASARIDASGATGGGAIAIGTTLARAVGGATVKARTARFVTVAAGAHIAADATTSGNGGIITVLSTEGSLIDGGFSARGGELAGNGGAIELSGEKGFRWGGAVDARAPHGTVGGVTFDPGNIDITNNAADHGGSFTNTGGANANIYDADITAAGLTASVTVKAKGNITVDSGVALVSKNGLVLNAGNDIDVLGASGTLTAASIASSGAITFTAGANITIAGSVATDGTGAAGVITMTAGSVAVGGHVNLGGITVGNTLLANHVILAATGGIAINADIDAASALDVSAGGGVAQAGGGTITTASLTSASGVTGALTLTGATNHITGLGPITVTAGSLAVTTTTSLQVAGALTADTVALASGGGIGIGASVTAAAQLDLSTTLGGVSQTVGVVTTASLASAGGITGDVALTGGNDIAALGSIAVTAGNLAVATTGTLTIAGAVSVGSGHAIALKAPALLFAAAGTSNPAGSLVAPGGIVELAPQAVGSVTLGSGAANPLIHNADLARITTGLLRIGAAGGVTTASGINVDGTFDAGAKSLELDAGTLGIGFGGTTAASVAAASLQLTTAGTIGESTASTLTAADIGASASGAVKLLGTGNVFSTLDAVTAGGAVSIFDSSGLTVGGALSAAGQSVSLDAQGTLAVNAPITAASLDVIATGTLSQSAAGTLRLASLSGRVGGPIILANAANAIQALGNLSSLQGAGNITVATSGGLTISGLVQGGTVDLSTGGTLSEGTGSIQATQLFSTGGLGGTVHLDHGQDSIQLLGSIAVAGTVFAIADTQGLTVDGAVSVANGGIISVIAPSLRFAGGTLTASGGTVEVAPIGAPSAAVIGLGHGALLLGSDLGNITATTLRIGRAEGATTALGLTVTGSFDASAFATLELAALGDGIVAEAALSGQAVSLGSTGALSMGYGSSITATGLLELAVTGATQLAGAVIDTPILTTNGSISGAILLDSSDNRIVALGALSGALPGSISSLIVRTATSLDVVGAVAAASVILNSAGTIGIAADIAASASLDLTASGAVTQTGAGSIATASVTSSGGIVGALTLGSANNRIAALGPVTVSAGANGSATNLLLTTAGSLNVTGALSADTITLSSGGVIGLGASVQALTSLDLAAATGVTQTAGGIATATLLSSGGISGDVSLTAANAVASIGSFTVTGNATLVDATLSVAGAVSVGDGHTLSIASNDFSMTAAGSLSAGSTGLIEIGPDASATTIVNIGGGTGGIRPGDLSAITAGTLRLGRSAADGGTELAASITIGGAVSAAHIGTLDLQSSGAVTQTTGAVSLATLTGHAGGGLSIALVGNTIATIGSLSAGGPISIANSGAAQALHVAGPVSTSAAGDVTLSSPTLAISGTITPNAGNVALAADNFSLTGAINDAGNTVGLAPFTSGGTLTLGALGSIAAATFRAGDAATAGIVFTTAVDFGGGTTLELDSAGVITQAANASISAGFLTGTVGGATLDQGNHIGTLGGLTSAGAFTLINATATPLTVDGPVRVTGPALLTLGAATMTINPGTLNSQPAVASGGGVLLQANALGFGPGSGIAVEATSGVAISTFNNAATAQTLTGPALIVAPSLVIGGDGSVTRASALSLGHVAFVGTSLDLVSTGGIVQTDSLETSGGATLNASAGSGVALDTQANAIATLGNISTQAGNIAIRDDTPVTLGGSIAAPGTITLTDRFGGTSGVPITIGAGSTLRAGAVVLNTFYNTGTNAIGVAIGTATGPGITEGVIDTGTLSVVTDTGSVNLTGTANAVGALGPVTVSAGAGGAHDFSLTDSAILHVTGPLSAGHVTLADTAAGVAGSAIDQTAAGGVHADTLSASAASGDIVLTSAANAIAALGDVTAPGTIQVASAGTMALAGTVSGQRIGLAAGTLGYTSGSLIATDLIELAPVAPAAMTLAATAGGGNLDPLLLAHSQTPILRLGQITGGAITATSLTIIDPVSINVGSIGTLDLRSTGAISESGSLAFAGGTITAQGASLALTGGNSFATLGAVTVAPGGDIAVADTQVLSAGPLTARAITLTGDSLTLTGAQNATTLTLNTTNTGLAGGAAVSATGPINAATLSGSVASGDMTLGNAGNAIDRLGVLSVAGTLALADSATLGETAQSIVQLGGLRGSLTAGADLSVGGNSIAGIGGLTVNGGNFALVNTGPLSIAGTLTDATGTIALSTTGLLTLGGAVSAGALVSVLANGMTEAAGGSLAATGVAGAVEIAPETVGVMTIGGSQRGADFDPAALAQVSATTLRLGQVGGEATPRATAIDFTANTVVDTPTLDLRASGAVIQPASVALTLAAAGATLTGTTGGVQLLGALNAIPRLGPYTTSGGDFRLVDNRGLSVVGDINAANVTLAVAGGLTIDTGSLLANAGVVDLTATAGTEDAAGIIAAATLTSSGTPSGIFDLGTANQIAALGAWSSPTGTLALRDTATGGLAITGAVNVATLDLSSAGILSESGAGSVTATLLRSRLGAGGASLGAVNAIGTLGGFSVGAGSFALNNGTSPLSVAGVVAGGGIALTSSALLTIGNGGVLQAAGGTVNLMTGGATETGGGVIDASTLIGAQALAGDFVLAGGNTIGTLGGWTTTGALVLVDMGATLLVSGPVAVPTLTLSAQALQLAGNITAGTASFSGATAQIGTGILNAGTVNASGASLDLRHAGNLVGTLGSVGVTGAVLVTDAATLTTDSVSGGSVSLTTTGDLRVAGSTTGTTAIVVDAAGALTLLDGGSLNTPAGTLDLTSNGATESGSGRIRAGTLLSTGTPGGTIDLTNTGNAVARLGHFAMGGGALRLTDSSALNVGDTGHIAHLVLSAPSIAIAGTLDGGIVDLSASVAGVAEGAGGAVLAGLLTSAGNVAGGVTLTNAANVVTTLGAFATSGGDFALTSHPGLSVAGIVSAPDIALATPGALSIVDGGALVSPGGFVDLTANGATEHGHGHIQAATLQSVSGQAAGVLALTGANLIGTLGRFTMPTGTLSLTDTATLTVGGPFSGPNLTLSAPGLIFAGNVLPANQVLDLVVGAGGVSQPGGTIATALLTGSVGGITTLGGGNAIVDLGAFNGTGAVAITNARDLTITGAVRAPAGIALHVTGTVSELAGGGVTASALRGAGTGAVDLGQAANAIGALAFNAGGAFHLVDVLPLAIDGPLVAASVTLNVAGDVTERGGGVIDTGLFTGSARDFLLTAANGIVTLGSVGVTGTVRLTDAGPLIVTDTSLVPSLTLDASGITLAGLAQGGTVDLTATNGGIDETPGGSLQAGLLTSSGNVVGGVTLTNAANVVTTLGAFATSGGDFALTSHPGLSVAGIVSAPDIALATPGALSIVDGGALVSPGGFVDLTANGATEHGHGHIQAATLQSVSGQAAGVLALTGANNIATLGRFTMASGTLALTDTGTLVVGGPVTTPNLVLTAPGVVFAGAAHLGTLDMAIGGGVAQAAGTIDAGLLTGTVAGTVALDDANAIVDLGNLTGGGAVAITNARDLTITGVVSAPSGIAFAVAGTLSEAAGGTLLTSVLSGSANGDTTLTQAANAIAAIRFSSLNGIHLTDSHALDIDGSLSGATVTLNVAGDLTESGGPITTGQFAGTAANMALTARNQIASLGDIAVPGSFTLLDGRDLAIAGTLAASTVDLSTNAGSVSGAGVILASRLQSGGGIQGNVDLVNPGNSLGTVGNFAATGSIDYASNLDPVIDGALVAPGGLTLNVAGALTEAGAGSITTSGLRGTALGGATLDAARNAIDTIAFSTGAADLSLTDGVALAITGTLAGRRIAIADAARVTETGAIDAAGLSGSATSFALGGANRIATLGDITADAILLVDAGKLAITGTVRTAAFDLSMLSGDVTESGAILAGTLSSGSGMAGSAVLASASNRIGTLGNIQAGGNLVVADSVALTIAGSLTAPVVDLSTSAGGIRQVGGGIVTALLDSSAGIVGDAGFTQPANQIAALGAMPVSGQLALADATSLVVAGPVSTPGASLTTPGGIDFAGNLAVPGVLTLNTGDGVRRSGGQFVVGTLTGNVASTADFGAGTLVGTLGDFTVTDSAPGAAASSSFALANAQPLTLAGTLNADFIQLTATGLLTWSGDIVTEGLSSLQQTAAQPTPPGSYLSVVADSNGRAIIDQTGVTHIVAQDGALATVRLQLPATGGRIVLNDLEGPATDLLLFTGAGTATGRVNLAGLFVSGLNGGTSLIGTISGHLGSAAARASGINPKPDTNYRINACPIRSVNCILLPLATVAPTNPLQDFSIGQARDDADDSDVLLPNVSDKDY